MGDGGGLGHPQILGGFNGIVYQFLGGTKFGAGNG